MKRCGVIENSHWSSECDGVQMLLEVRQVDENNEAWSSPVCQVKKLGLYVPDSHLR